MLRSEANFRINQLKVARWLGPSCIVILTVNGFVLAWGHLLVIAPKLVLISVVGGLLGWAVAVLATPDGAKDEENFKGYFKAAAGFLSGFAFTKANDLLTRHADRFTSWLDRPGHVEKLSYGLGYFVSFFLIGLMWTFLGRRYNQASQPEAEVRARRYRIS